MVVIAGKKTNTILTGLKSNSHFEPPLPGYCCNPIELQTLEEAFRWAGFSIQASFPRHAQTQHFARAGSFMALRERRLGAAVVGAGI